MSSSNSALGDRDRLADRPDREPDHVQRRPEVMHDQGEEPRVDLGPVLRPAAGDQRRHRETNSLDRPRAGRTVVIAADTSKGTCAGSTMTSEGIFNPGRTRPAEGKVERSVGPARRRQQVGPFPAEHFCREVGLILTRDQ